MMQTAIDFDLDQANSVGEWDYRPFGTRTLKLRLRSRTADQPPLRLRPFGSDRNAATFRGFADDSAAIQVSWGGGHEPGPPIKAEDRLVVFEEPAALAAGESSYLYFNLTHVDSSEVPETAVLTLQAYSAERIVSTLTITLRRPATWSADAVRRLQPVGQNQWQVSDGTLLPAYDPRWWPESAAYVAEVGPLPLTIEHHAPVLVIKWRDEIVALLTDNTNPPVGHFADDLTTANFFSFDFFAVDEHHVALRIWFFWLNKQIGNDFFVGRHEVPDAERFDFLLNKPNGTLRFVCTDLHWAEVWGEVVERPQRVALGLSREMVWQEVQHKVGDAWQKVAGWFGAGEETAVSEATSPHNPINHIRQRLSQQAGQQTAVGDEREKGTEAHVPQLINTVEEDADPVTGRNRFVSNDVRLVLLSD